MNNEIKITLNVECIRFEPEPKENCNQPKYEIQKFLSINFDSYLIFYNFGIFFFWDFFPEFISYYFIDTSAISK
jgi:hypothetical protein